MKKNELKILDCTLRDGGYYNNWYFQSKFFQKKKFSLLLAELQH